MQREEAEAAHGDELRLAGLMETEQLDLVRNAGQLAEVTGEVAAWCRGVSVPAATHAARRRFCWARPRPAAAPTIRASAPYLG